MKESKTLLQRHEIIYLLPAGVALGFLAQWLFIGQMLGASWPIFTVALLAVLILIGRHARIQVERSNLWLWPALLFFATMVFLRANSFLTFLNVSTTLGLLAFVFYFYAAGMVSDLPLSRILIQPWRMAGQTLTNLDPAITASIEPLSVKRSRGRNLAPVLLGGVIALPVLAVFTMLLASADLVLQAHMQRLVHLDFEKLAPIAGRGLFVGLVALLATGAMATAVIHGLRPVQDDESRVERLVRNMPLHLSLGATETGTILFLVSALFLGFVLLQFKYLFGGEANISGAGFTYADYARRGFFELVLVASLSLALILVLNWLTRRESKRQIKGFNGFSTVLISLVLVILFTAFWRMRLYQQAYGYTELRLIVLVFEIWLGLLLIWFLITLWRKPERFAVGVMLAALGFVATLNLINPDALIVRHNLQRYRETGDLDVEYLSYLSTDAVPALVAAYDDMEEDDQRLYHSWCTNYTCDVTMNTRLSRNLRARYKSMLEEPNWLVGRSYHMARYRAAKALVCFYEPEATAVRIGRVEISCKTG